MVLYGSDTVEECVLPTGVEGLWPPTSEYSHSGKFSPVRILRGRWSCPSPICGQISWSMHDVYFHYKLVFQSSQQAWSYWSNTLPRCIQHAWNPCPMNNLVSCFWYYLGVDKDVCCMCEWCSVGCQKNVIILQFFNWITRAHLNTHWELRRTYRRFTCCRKMSIGNVAACHAICKVPWFNIGRLNQSQTTPCWKMHVSARVQPDSVHQESA